MTTRVAIVGGFGWSDQDVVRDRIRELLADLDEIVVLLDGDPTDVHVAALRECRCSGVVAVQYQLPGSAGKRVMEMRAKRDAVLFGDADVVVVFGELSPDRLENLRLAALPPGRASPLRLECHRAPGQDGRYPRPEAP